MDLLSLRLVESGKSDDFCEELWLATGAHHCRDSNSGYRNRDPITLPLSYSAIARFDWLNHLTLRNGGVCVCFLGPKGTRSSTSQVVEESVGDRPMVTPEAVPLIDHLEDSVNASENAETTVKQIDNRSANDQPPDESQPPVNKRAKTVDTTNEPSSDEEDRISDGPENPGNSGEPQQEPITSS